MKQQTRIVIAALMITSMALAVSTSAVNATHVPTVEITPTLTKTGDIDFEIDVTNTGGSPIIKVEADLPFTVGDWVGTLMADNVAPSTEIAEGTVLFAGTGILITPAYDLTLVEGTPITISKTEPIVKLLSAGDGTAEWTNEQVYTGSYSVKLTHPEGGGWDDSVEVRVYYDKALSEITTIDDFKYWYSYKGVAHNSYAALCLDTDSDGKLDYALVSQKQAAEVYDGTWTSTTQTDLWEGNEYDAATGKWVYDTPRVQQSLTAWKSEYTEAQVIYVAVGWGPTTVPALATESIYIDDITIGATTYSVEPTTVFETGIDIVAGITVIVPAGTKTDGTGQIIMGIAGTPGTSGTSTGTEITIPAEGINLNANNTIGLKVDGAGSYVVFTIASVDTYTTGEALVENINAATDGVPSKRLDESGVSASWVPTTENKGYIVFTSDTVGHGSSVVVNPASTAAPVLGFDGGATETTGTLRVTLLYDTRVTTDGVTYLAKPRVKLSDKSPVILPAGTEIELTALIASSLPNSVTLASDTHAVLSASVDAAKLCEDTEGKIGPDDIEDATLISETTCPLVEDNKVDFPATFTPTIKVLEGTKVVLPLISLTMPLESELELGIPTAVTLWDASTVVLDKDVPDVPINATAEFTLPNSEVTATLTSQQNVMLPEGTEIELPKDAEIQLKGGVNDNAKLALPIPDDWEVATIDEATDTVTWENATTDSAIGPGESQTFSIRATTVTGGEYLWTIMTTAADGSVAYRTLTTTVDGTPPTLTVTMEPDEVGEGPATIKVEASEKLSNLDNVYVELDDNADRRTLISMTPDAERKVWTGTVTIPSNGLWDDNKVDIVVLAAETKDMAGNALEFDNYTTINDPDVDLRRINTIPPLLPANLEMTGIGPFENEVNQKSQLITGIAQDNISGEPEPLEGMTVKISVNTTMYETESFALGAFTKEIDLNEGPNTIKVWVIDNLGNIGPENEQAVFLDTIKPAISMDSVAGKAYEDNVPVNDNTPTVVLTIKDPGYPATALGIEFTDIVATLENADGTFSVGLDNATPWDKATGRFENTIPLAIIDTSGLPDGFYRILVDATDAVTNNNSATFWFEVDTIVPVMPTLSSANNPVLFGTSVTEPKVQKATKLVLYGSGLEPSCEVKVYLVDQATGSVISTETTAADTAGGFSKSLTLVGGKTIRIEVETSDAAGNVSSRLIYGYAMADATAPVVTLETLPEMTDETSIILSGTVDKDAWEDWSDITLTVQVGIGSVEVQIGAEGGYSCSVPLSMGVNTIAARATDSVGNMSISATATVERVFTMDTTAPSVTLDALPEATDKASITISGTVSKDAWEDWSDITLTVQVGTERVEVPIGAGGSYDYSIGLAEGSNTIAVQATDGVGNTGTAAYARVERTVTPWAIYAIILVIIALVMAAIAIFRKKR